MNNWLGFSLSGQGNPQPHQNGSPTAAAIDVSGGGDFYGLQAQTPPDAHLGMPGLRADANYGVMDGFTGGNQETQGELQVVHVVMYYFCIAYTFV